MLSWTGHPPAVAFPDHRALSPLETPLILTPFSKIGKNVYMDVVMITKQIENVMFYYLIKAGIHESPAKHEKTPKLNPH
jgi:hypothetical protein